MTKPSRAKLISLSLLACTAWRIPMHTAELQPLNIHICRCMLYCRRDSYCWLVLAAFLFQQIWAMIRLKPLARKNPDPQPGQGHPGIQTDRKRASISCSDSTSCSCKRARTQKYHVARHEGNSRQVLSPDGTEGRTPDDLNSREGEKQASEPKGHERQHEHTAREKNYDSGFSSPSHEFHPRESDSSPNVWSSSLASAMPCDITTFLNLHTPSTAQRSGPESQGIDWAIRLFPELVSDPGKIF